MNISLESRLITGFKKAEMKLFVSSKLDDLEVFLRKAKEVILSLKSVLNSEECLNLDVSSIVAIQNVTQDSKEWIIARLYDETIKVENNDEAFKPLDDRVSEKVISILNKVSQDLTENKLTKQYAQWTLEKYQKCTVENNKVNWAQADLLITDFEDIQRCFDKIVCANLGCM